MRHYLRCPVLWRTVEEAASQLRSIEPLERLALLEVMTDPHRIDRIRLVAVAATVVATIAMTPQYSKEVAQSGFQRLLREVALDACSVCGVRRRFAAAAVS